MARKILVLVKQPGKAPHHVWLSNRLESLQGYVGGYIETVTLATDLVVICNEEGRLLKGMKPNCTICGVNFVGPIIMAGIYGDEFADLPLEWDEMKRLFPELWEATV
ncbi:MAG: DUF3846 domain-containing protein [Oscillospiraceae bacterium]|nr:DUF3846 domain-containing protein [Oscillospiraceae bacterium]